MRVYVTRIDTIRRQCDGIFLGEVLLASLGCALCTMKGSQETSIVDWIKLPCNRVYFYSKEPEELKTDVSETGYIFSTPRYSVGYKLSLT